MPMLIGYKKIIVPIVDRRVKNVGRNNYTGKAKNNDVVSLS